MSTETGPQADPNLITLRERMVRALLAPRYGGPQHNTPGGLPLTATPEQARRHRAEQTVDTVLAELPAALAQHVARAIFALKTPSPDGSAHYQSGWDDGVEAAMDAARDAVLSVLSGGAPAHAADHEPVWVTAMNGDNEPALDAEGKTWTHCGVCGVVRGGAPGAPVTIPVFPADGPKVTVEVNGAPSGSDSRHWQQDSPVTLATECANPECEHTLNWHTGTPGGVCVARGAACPCDAFVPPAAKEQP